MRDVIRHVRDDVTFLTQQHNSADGKLRELGDNTRSLSDNTRLLQEDVSDLKGQKETLRNTVGEMSSQQQKLSGDVGELKTKVKDIDIDVNRQYTEVSRIDGVCQVAQSKCSELETVDGSMQQELRGLRDKAVEIQNEVSQVQEESSELRSEVRSIQSGTEALQETFRSVMSGDTAGMMGTSLRSMQDGTAKIRREFLDLQRHLGELSNDMVVVKGDLRMLVNESHAMLRGRRSMQDRLMQLELDTESSNSDLRRLMSQSLTTATTLTTLENQYTDMSHDLEQLRTRNITAREKMTEVTQNQLLTNSTMYRLQNDVFELFRLTNRLQSSQGESVREEEVMTRLRNLNSSLHGEVVKVDTKLERVRLKQEESTRNVTRENSAMLTLLRGLNGEVESLREAKGELMTTQTNISEEVQSLKWNITGSIESFRLNQNELITGQRRIEEDVQSLKWNYSELARSTESLRRNQSELITGYRMIDEDVERLKRSQSEVISASNQLITSTRTRFSSLQTRLTDVTSQLQQLQTDLQENQQEDPGTVSLDVNTELRRIRDEVDKVKRNQSELSHSLRSVQTDLSALKKDVQSIPATIEAHVNNNPQDFSDLEADLATLTQHVQDAQAEIDQLKLNTDQAATTHELRAVQERLDTLRADLVSMATDEDVGSLRSEMVVLRGQISANLSTVNQQVKSLEILVTDRSDLDLRREVNQVQRDLEDMGIEVNRVREGVTGLEERFQVSANQRTRPGQGAQGVTSRLVEDVTVMTSRLDQLRNDVMSLRDQGISQGRDLIQLQQDFRELGSSAPIRGGSTNETLSSFGRLTNHTFLSLSAITNQTLQKLFQDLEGSISPTLEGATNSSTLLLALSSLQQMLQHTSLLAAGLQTQMRGVRHDFAGVLQEVTHFQRDLDELQWNNAQLYYDMVAMQQWRDVVARDGRLAT